MKTIALAPLPFPYNSLEPHMDEETLHIHHDKHHQTYVNKYNELITSNTEIADQTLFELLSNTDNIPSSIKQSVINHGGGVYNHNFFWKILTPNAPSEPQGKLKKVIDTTFGDFATFKSEFSTAASLNFGSGWTWLVKDSSDKLKILNTANQDSPISQNLTPLLTLDTWDHAYYLKYQNKRPEYIDAFWNIINWTYVEALFEGSTSPDEC